LLLGRTYEIGADYRGVWGLYGSYDYIAPQSFRVSTTALSLGSELGGMVVYDRRLAAAARDAGLQELLSHAQGVTAALASRDTQVRHLIDDGDELCGQFLDLLRAQILAREIDVFVQRHEKPFLWSQCRRPWRLAPRALRERLECSEGGNTGRRA